MPDPFSPVALTATFHGFMGLLVLLLYSASVIDLMDIAKKKIKRLQYTTLGMTLIVWITSLSGLFLYIFYRAPAPTSPRSLIKAGEFPFIHEVFFELKEHIGMFPPIIFLLAAFIVWYYKEELVPDRKMRNAVLALVTLGFLWTLATFGLGALVAKVQPL